jgi:hypothetical protein
MFEKAIEYMDDVLIEPIPTVSADDSRRFQFPKQALGLSKRLK